MILGLNAYHGDSSAALLVEGRIVAALEEERLNRIKHWAGLPVESARECLHGYDAGAVTHIAVSRDPKANLGAKLSRALRQLPALPSLASRAKNSIHITNLGSHLEAAGLGLPAHTKIHFVEHHRAHLASAFFASPFEEAAVASIDGFGDFSSVMWGVGRGTSIDVFGSVRFPHSLGIFYTAFTQFLGFRKYGDEYKMMGLAAYGEPRFATLVRDVVRVADGRVELNLDYFTHHIAGVDMSWEGGEPSLGCVYARKMVDTFGEPRKPRTDILTEHADLAASVQLVLEERYFELLRHCHRVTRSRKLCLAGGVALNCAANGKLFEQTPFTDVYVQAAAHDAGTSLGAALYVEHQILERPRRSVMDHVYLGPEYDDAAILSVLRDRDVEYHRLDRSEVLDRTAQEIAQGKVVGWFQGRMEFGPRALGNRSILADPRRPEMKDTLNKRIKYREPFRPFCPSILLEAVGDYFEISYPSPFMVQAYPIRSSMRGKVPAITHKDGTGRLQTVDRNVNPLYWDLIKAFERLTGVPILLNTSFNENEPIVNTPSQALECFLRTQMDVLVIGPYLLIKAENAHRTADRASQAEAAATAADTTVTLTSR